MKLVEGGIELTERNLTTLLNKLKFNRDQRTAGLGNSSYCTIVTPEGNFFVRAVEDDAHYSDRLPGPMLNNETGELV